MSLANGRVDITSERSFSRSDFLARSEYRLIACARHKAVCKARYSMRFDRKASLLRSPLAVLCAIFLLPGDTPIYASQSPPAQSSPNSQVSKVSPDQLDSLVAPIALYPDPLLAQVLAASTYPLEIVLLQRWL